MAKNNMLLIIGAAVLVIWFLNQDTTTTPPPTNGGPNEIPCGVESTVTLESKDMYSPGTDAGTAHLIISAGDGGLLENTVIADGSSKALATCDSFNVLVGNVTDAAQFTAGTTYYPVMKTGTIPRKEQYTLEKDQPLSAAKSDLTFTWWDSSNTANTDVALGASDTETIEIELKIGADKCLGNPDTGGKNVMCFGYESAYISDLELQGASRASIPDNEYVCNGNTTKCFEVPVLCDNAKYEANLELTSNANPTTDHNITVSIHDVSYYVNDDTLVANSGIQDEDLNDIGIADIGISAGVLDCAGGGFGIGIA